MTTTPTPEPQLVELGSGRRMTLRQGHHDRYFVTEEPDGTLVLRPALLVSPDELILHQNPWLEEQLERSFGEPTSPTRRGRLKKKE